MILLPLILLLHFLLAKAQPTNPKPTEIQSNPNSITALLNSSSVPSYENSLGERLGLPITESKRVLSVQSSFESERGTVLTMMLCRLDSITKWQYNSIQELIQSLFIL